MKRLVSLLALAALTYLAACAYLFFGQRSFLYFPTTEAHPPDATALSLSVDGETLRLWKSGTDTPEAILYFGGNAEDVSGNLSGFVAAMPDKAIYLVNYRGYGGSTGKPSESAFYRDALAEYDWLLQKHQHVSVIGRSLGTGVATCVAAARKVDKLVLVTPFDSIVNVAKKSYRIFPVSLLLKDRFDSASRVSQITARTLVLVAEHDEVIPRESSDALIARFPAGQATVVVFKGASHNTISESPEYARLLSRFL